MFAMRSLLPLQLAVVLALCVWLWIKTTAVDPLPDWHQGELVVIVPPAEMETENAFETELAEQFAQQLQVKLRTVPLPIDQEMHALSAHKAHLAAGVRPTTDYPLRFGKTFQTLEEQLICNGSTPDDLDELDSRKVVVAAGSPQEAALREVRHEHEKAGMEIQKRHLAGRIAGGSRKWQTRLHGGERGANCHRAQFLSGTGCCIGSRLAYRIVLGIPRRWRSKAVSTRPNSSLRESSRMAPCAN